MDLKELERLVFYLISRLEYLEEEVKRLREDLQNK